VLSVCHHNRLGPSGFQTFFLLLLTGNTRLRRFPCRVKLDGLQMVISELEVEPDYLRRASRYLAE
jgi:hypothetical protein